MATPINFRGFETAEQLKTASPAFSQFVCDKKRVELWQLPNLLDTGATDNAESMGAGAPEMAEVNSAEIGGLLIAASNDSYGHFWVLPVEIDVSKDINFRVLWSETGTGGSGSAQFVVKYTPLTLETTAVAIGATALGTVIAADTPSTTAHCLQGSPWGVLAGATLTNTPGDDVLAMITTCTLTTITDASMYQLQVEYSRRFVN